MFQKIKIKTGLYSGIAMFTLLLIIISVIGLSSANSSNKSLLRVDKIKGDQIIPLYMIYSDLLSARLTAQNIALRIEDNKEIEKNEIDFKKLAEQIDSADKKMDELRKITAITEKGKKLRIDLEKTYNMYVNDTIKPMAGALREKNTNYFYDTLVKKSAEQGNNFKQSLISFTNLAQVMSNTEIENAHKDHVRIVIIMSVVIFITLATIITTIQFFNTIVLKPIEKVRTYFNMMGNGNMNFTIPDQYKTEMGLLLLSLRDMQSSLKKIVNEVRDASSAVASGSEQIAASNRDFSARTEEQAASVEETAASMEQLTSSVKETSSNTVKGMELTDTVTVSAKKNASNFDNIMQRIKAISDSSEKINNIISVMDSIAFQTNILALNAAVEAARAGEAGKGFAVVAAEVRNLAQRSAGSAREIKELINETSNEVLSGSRVAKESVGDMDYLVDQIEKVNQYMKEISLAANEQAKGIEQVNIAISQLEQVSQQNATLVEESTSVTRLLTDQSQSLNASMSFFR